MGTARTTIDPPQRATRPGPDPEPPLWGAAAAPAGAAVATAAVAAQLLEAGFDLLPGGGIVGPLTLVRLIVLLGIGGVVLAGARLDSFRTGLDIPLALLLVAAVATTARGGWDAAPLRFLITALATYYLVVATLRVVPESRWALALLAIAAAGAAGAIGIAQVAEGEFTGFYRDGLEPITSTIERPELQVRATGPFINPNLLAAFVALTVPIGALAAIRMRDTGLRWGVLVLAVVAEIGLVLTFSRAAVISVVAGVVVLAVVMPQLRRARRAVLSAAGGLVLVLVLAALATGGRAVGGFGRTEAWGLALDAAAQDRLVGIGLGRAGDVMNALGDGDETFAHAHDLWLNWLAEAGPLAFLAMAFVAFWVVAEGVRLARTGAPAPAAALAGLTAFLLMSLVDHPGNSERIAIVFWIVVAALAADATRRVTPGLFTHERFEDDTPAVAGEAAPVARLADPVPPRAGPAAGEGVRVIKPGAAPTTPVPPDPLGEATSGTEATAAPEAEAGAGAVPEHPATAAHEAGVAPEPAPVPEAEAVPEPRVEAEPEPEPGQEAEPEPEPEPEAVAEAGTAPRREAGPEPEHETGVFPAPGTEEVAEAAAEGPVEDEEAADPASPARTVDTPTAPFDPGQTAPMTLPFEPLPPEPRRPAPAARPEPAEPAATEEPVPVEDPAGLFARLGAGLEASRDAERTSMMGQPGIRIDRRYVAALVDGRELAVRLGPGRAAAMVREGAGREFAPAGRPLEGWVVLGERTESAWRDALTEAVDAAEAGEESP